MRNLVKYFKTLVMKKSEQEIKYDQYEYGTKEFLYTFSSEYFKKLVKEEQSKIEALLTTIKDLLMQTTLDDLKNELMAILPKKMDYPIYDIKVMLEELDYQELFKLYFKIHEFNKNEEKLKNRLLNIFHKYLNPQLAEKMVELAAFQYRHYRYNTAAGSDPGSRTGFYFDFIIPYRNEIAAAIKVLAANIKPNEVPRSSLSYNFITFFGAEFHKIQHKSKDLIETAIDFSL